MSVKSAWLRKVCPVALPAGVVVATAIVLWLTAGRASNRPLGFVGLCEILLVTSGITCIVSGATVTHLRTCLISLCSVAIWSAIVFACIGVGGGVIGLGECFRLSIVVAAWTALAMSMGRVCKTAGAGVSVGITAAVSAFLCASPVVMMPLVRALTGAPWQPRLVQAIAATCPLLAAIESVRPAIRVDWAVLPGMYEMSGLGQEVPMTLAPWWVNAGIYAAAALLLAISGQWGVVRTKHQGV